MEPPSLLRAVSHTTRARAPPTRTLRKRVLHTDGILYIHLPELVATVFGDSVHFKGFAARINFEDAKTQMEADHPNIARTSPP